MQINSTGSMIGFYFLKERNSAIVDYDSAKEFDDTKLYGKFFHQALARGIYFAPSQFEATFMSTAHTNKDISSTLEIMESILKSLID